MTSDEFAAIRHQLGKTQAQMACLLGVSVKAVQSFEQGWRKVPMQTERQALFLLVQKITAAEKGQPCWEIRQCSPANKSNCPAWEFSLGHLCWFVNGTLCHGEPQRNWQEKMKICRQCEAFPAGTSWPSYQA